MLYAITIKGTPGSPGLLMHNGGRGDRPRFRTGAPYQGADQQARR